MIKSDNHVHTSFSTDSDTLMEKMLIRALEIGFSSICFTDHIDYDFPTKKSTPEFLFDISEYFNEMKRLEPIYTNIKIRYGIELGIKPDIAKKCLNLTSSFPFDFVIGSTHLVNNIDPYFDIFWENTDENTAILSYYESTLENIKSGVDFDVYGHIDYIIRYTPYMKKLRAKKLYDENYINEKLEKSLEIIEEILKTLLSLGKGIEINTGGLKYGLGHTHPHEKILKMYKELGGEIITVGSDAHEPKYLGYEFNKAAEILKSCGFKYYTEFTSRKPDMISI